MTEIKTAIFHSLLGKENVCCLCFNEGSELVHIEDEAVADGEAFSNVQLTEVLAFILGYDLADKLVSQFLCKSCVVSAIHSYTFIKRCRENAGNLQKAVTNIENCLQNTPEQSCKSIFLSLDTNLDAQMYCDYKRPVNSLLGALARFKYVSTDKSNGKYYAQCSGMSADSDSDEFKDDMHVKQNKAKPWNAKGRRYKIEYPPDSVMFHENSTCKKPICNGCKKTFENSSILRMHYIRVHARKKLKCSKCDRKFSSRKLLENHLRLSHTNAICFECGKTFTNIPSLKRHEQSHKAAKYICQICHRVYKTLRTIQDHINTGVCKRDGVSRRSMNKGEFICDICNTRFTSKNAVRSHLITKHDCGSDKVVHTCPWCNKRFMAASSLKGHIVKHTGEKKFQCDLCDEKFVTPAGLVKHNRLHTGEKPYACEYCDKCFVTASGRMEHLRCMHWEPSMPCRLCPAIFKSSSSKRKHEKRHFDPSSKFYVPKALRPEGIKEPNETHVQNRPKKKVLRIIPED